MTMPEGRGLLLLQRDVALGTFTTLTQIPILLDRELKCAKNGKSFRRRTIVSTSLFVFAVVHRISYSTIIFQNDPVPNKVIRKECKLIPEAEF